MQCGEGKKCCIHSGNIIPLTGGRCIGGNYIGCQPDGFACNPILFGTDSNGGFNCVPKRAPHEYTKECINTYFDSNKSSAQTYSKDHKLAWDAFRQSIYGYCDGGKVQRHNVKDCDALKQKISEVTDSAGASQSVEPAKTAQ